MFIEILANMTQVSDVAPGPLVSIYNVIFTNHWKMEETSIKMGGIDFCHWKQSNIRGISTKNPHHIQ